MCYDNHSAHHDWDTKSTPGATKVWIWHIIRNWMLWAAAEHHDGQFHKCLRMQHTDWDDNANLPVLNELYVHHVCGIHRWSCTWFAWHSHDFADQIPVSTICTLVWGLNLSEPSLQIIGLLEPWSKCIAREESWTELDLNLKFGLTVWILNPGSGPNFSIAKIKGCITIELCIHLAPKTRTSY